MLSEKTTATSGFGTYNTSACVGASGYGENNTRACVRGQGVHRIDNTVISIQCNRPDSTFLVIQQARSPFLQEELPSSRKISPLPGRTPNFQQEPPLPGGALHFQEELPSSRKPNKASSGFWKKSWKASTKGEGKIKPWLIWVHLGEGNFEPNFHC